MSLLLQTKRFFVLYYRLISSGKKQNIDRLVLHLKLMNVMACLLIARRIDLLKNVFVLSMTIYKEML